MLFNFFSQVQTKILKDLPDMLVFNCHLENARDREFWKIQEEVRTSNEIYFII